MDSKAFLHPAVFLLKAKVPQVPETFTSVAKSPVKSVSGEFRSQE